MNRRGKSLIELMVVISVMSFALAAVGQMTVAMMRADTSQSAAMRRQNAATRLAARFRDDAHAAVRAEVKVVDGVPGVALILTADRRVVYSANGEGRVSRTIWENGAVEASEAWPSDGCVPRFSLSDDKATAILVLEPGTPTGKSSGASSQGPGLRVVATVGLDRRMAGGKSP